MSKEIEKAISKLVEQGEPDSELYPELTSHELYIPKPADDWPGGDMFWEWLHEAQNVRLHVENLGDASRIYLVVYQGKFLCIQVDYGREVNPEFNFMPEDKTSIVATLQDAINVGGKGVKEAQRWLQKLGK